MCLDDTNKQMFVCVVECTVRVVHVHGRVTRCV